MIILTNYSNRKLYYILGGMEEEDHWRINNVETDERGIAGNELSPKEAGTFDKKVDDGNPLNGNVRVIRQYNGVQRGIGNLIYDDNDAADNCIHNSKYNVALSDDACTLSILNIHWKIRV
jgi:hypothetical protein